MRKPEGFIQFPISYNFLEQTALSFETSPRDPSLERREMPEGGLFPCTPSGTPRAEEAAAAAGCRRRLRGAPAVPRPSAPPPRRHSRAPGASPDRLLLLLLLLLPPPPPPPRGASAPARPESRSPGVTSPLGRKAPLLARSSPAAGVPPRRDVALPPRPANTQTHTHTQTDTDTHTPTPPQKARRGRSGRTNSEHLQTGAHSPRLPGRAAAPGREPCRRRAAPRPPRGCRLRWGKASGTGEFTAPGHRLRLGCFGKRHSRCSPSSPQGSGSQFSASRCCLVSLLVTQHYLLGLTKGLPCHRQRERHAWRCAADSAPRTVL